MFNAVARCENQLHASRVLHPKLRTFEPCSANVSLTWIVTGKQQKPTTVPQTQTAELAMITQTSMR
jgi:hypothetical protein